MECAGQWTQQVWETFFIAMTSKVMLQNMLFFSLNKPFPDTCQHFFLNFMKFTQSFFNLQPLWTKVFFEFPEIRQCYL